MRSTFDFDPARPRSGDHRRQDCLKHKSAAARRPNGKVKLAGTDRARYERELLGTQRGALEFSTSNLRCRLDCCQVLSQQSRLLSICANVLDSERFSGDERQTK